MNSSFVFLFFLSLQPILFLYWFTKGKRVFSRGVWSFWTLVFISFFAPVDLFNLVIAPRASGIAGLPFLLILLPFWFFGVILLLSGGIFLVAKGVNFVFERLGVKFPDVPVSPKILFLIITIPLLGYFVLRPMIENINSFVLR